MAVLLGLTTLVAAQTAPKPAAKAVPWKSYCHPTHEFCFKYPATWSMLGEVFNGNGVVVAPAQKQARELWDEVTVALVIPAPEGDEEPVTVAEAIAHAVSSVRKSGQSFETVQRQQRTVNGKPAELVKLRYTEQGTAREWVEDLVFIEGPDSEIYSVALKTAPATLPTMEPGSHRDGVPASGIAGRTRGSVDGIASNRALEISIGYVTPGSSPRLNVTGRSVGSTRDRCPFQIT